MNLLSKVYITINLQKLKDNIQHTMDLCKENSVKLAPVVKSICGDQQIIDCFNQSPVEVLADSRLDNFARFKTDKERFLIRPAVASEAEAVVKYCDTSLQCDLNTIMAIDKAAAAEGKTHNIILLVDIGDLRDGIMYTNQDALLSCAAFVHTSENLRLTGVATNYNCFMGYLPNEENMNHLVTLHQLIMPFYETDSPVVSGGNSSSTSILISDDLSFPKEFNQLRMGEAIMLGRDPADNSFIPGYETDVFTLHVPLIEVYEKESEAQSTQRRGVLSIGKQDLQLEHIIPRDSRIRVLGGCSDECVVDLSEAPEYKSGDELIFDLEYGALMTAFAGSFIGKSYID
ncbi:MAG: alanine racemase [Lachnospiraceae bacterium]|nr:alanine racemase [Lachnospiraceae bacterium]